MFIIRGIIFTNLVSNIISIIKNEIKINIGICI